MQSLMSGPEPLWTLIDGYILQTCREWAKGFIELVDARVELGETYDPAVLEVPLVLIIGVERNIGEGEPGFGDGEYHIDGIQYPYEIHIIANFPEQKDAKTFAAKAMDSIGDTFRADPTFGGLYADNGENVKFFDYDDGDLYVRGIAGQSTGNYTGIAVFRLVVHTEI